VQSTRTNVDQPFVRALGISNTDIFMSDLMISINPMANGNCGRLRDGGATYKSVSDRARKTSGQMSLRSAGSRGDNTVYAAFFGWRKFNAPLRLVT